MTEATPPDSPRQINKALPLVLLQLHTQRHENNLRPHLHHQTIDGGVVVLMTSGPVFYFHRSLDRSTIGSTSNQKRPGGCRNDDRTGSDEGYARDAGWSVASKRQSTFDYFVFLLLLPSF